MSRRYLVRIKPAELAAAEAARALPGTPERRGGELPRAVPIHYFTHPDGRPNPFLPYVILEIEDLVSLEGGPTDV